MATALSDAKRNPRLAHWIEYGALRAVELAVSLAPRRLALAVGGLVGGLLRFVGVRRKTVQKNFAHVGLWDKAQTEKIVRALYRNMGRYAADFLRRGKLPPYRLNDYEHYTSARATGKGTIILLAHFGNWELLASIWGRREGDLNVVAKPMGNPLVENWLHRKRTAAKVSTIYASNALRGMLTVLKRGGITAILIDQYMGAMGTPAPFLGKTASTVRTVAGLVRKTGAVAVPLHAVMRADGGYDINFFEAPPPPVPEGGGEEEAVSAIQARHNGILSQWVFERPEHWFGWFHRRFRGFLDYA
jgi:KDO2-lipid IV(A) lauroyltransferase